METFYPIPYKEMEKPIQHCCFSKIFHRRPIYEDSFDIFIMTNYSRLNKKYTPVFLKGDFFIQDVDINNNIQHYRLLYEWFITRDIKARLYDVALQTGLQLYYFEKIHIWDRQYNFYNKTICYCLSPKREPIEYIVNIINQEMNKKIIPQIQNKNS